jgi:hypothetical protein
VRAKEEKAIVYHLAEFHNLLVPILAETIDDFQERFPEADLRADLVEYSDRFDYAFRFTAKSPLPRKDCYTPLVEWWDTVRAKINELYPCPSRMPEVVGLGSYLNVVGSDDN